MLNAAILEINLVATSVKALKPLHFSLHMLDKECLQILGPAVVSFSPVICEHEKHYANFNTLISP